MILNLIVLSEIKTFLIETEQEYENAAARYEEIKAAPKGTTEHKEKLLLVHLISEYENKNITLPEVDPIEMIKIRMEDFGYKSADQWLHSLNHMDEQDHLPPHLKATIFEKLYNIAEYTNLSKEEQKMYNQDLKRKWDNEAVLAYREEKGLKEGIEQGEHKAKLEIAKNLKKEGLSIELIAKATNLSIEEIESL